jgi:hypothetical protein
VAVIQEGEATLYVAPLPDGPIVVLDGVAALIWAEACAGDRENLSSRVAASLDPPGEDIEREVEAFVSTLVERGLLIVSAD